jgi:hypothetical protein
VTLFGLSVRGTGAAGFSWSKSRGMATRRVITGFVGWAGCIRVVRVCVRAFVPVTWTFGDDARTKSSSWRGSGVWENGEGGGGGERGEVCCVRAIIMYEKV